MALRLPGQQRPLQRQLPFASSLIFLLLLLAVPAGMFLLYERALGQLERRLSAAVGIRVQLGGVWATCSPSLVLKDLHLGGARPLLRVARTEIELGWPLTYPPRVQRIRLLQPQLTLRGDALLRWLRGRRAGGTGADSSRPVVRPELVIEDGRLSLSLPSAAGQLQATSREIYARPEGNRQRLILGPSTLQLGQWVVAESASLAADLDPRSGRLLRLAALAGRAAHPLYPGAAFTMHRLSATAGSAGVSLQLEGKPAGRHTGRLLVRALLDQRQPLGTPLRAEIRCQDLALGSLAPILEPFGLELAEALVDGQLSASRQGDQLRLEASLEGRGLTVNHPLIAARPVGPLSARLELAAQVAPERGLLQLQRLRLVHDALALELDGHYQRLASGSELSLDLRLPDTSCQQVLAAVPAALAPTLQGMALAGDIGARGKLRLSTADLERTVVDLRFAPLTCKVLVDPPLADVHQLLGELTVSVPGPLEEQRPWTLGPSNPHFYPLARISPRLQTAFMVAEDSHFYRHNGFDVEQLRRAFVHNLQSGGLRGGSTISQQLVKNVFLSHDRTLARKLQEAVLTWRMEQIVPKSRILELYLNVIEMGPGIQGVGQAARRYFGVSPAALTTLQAARLAALAPSPRQLARRLDAPRPDRIWTDRIDLLLRLMRRRDAAQERAAKAQLSWLGGRAPASGQ